jgi:hypothetical protein
MHRTRQFKTINSCTMSSSINLSRSGVFTDEITEMHLENTRSRRRSSINAKKKCISFPFRHFPTRFDAGDAANDARDARDGVRRDARDGGAPSRDGGAPFEGVRGAGARKRREDEGYRRPTAKRGGFFFFF